MLPTPMWVHRHASCRIRPFCSATPIPPRVLTSPWGAHVLSQQTGLLCDVQPTESVERASLLPHSCACCSHHHEAHASCHSRPFCSGCGTESTEGAHPAVGGTCPVASDQVLLCDVQPTESVAPPAVGRTRPVAADHSALRRPPNRECRAGLLASTLVCVLLASPSQWGTWSCHSKPICSVMSNQGFSSRPGGPP
jgi:hypothetical protein